MPKPAQPRRRTKTRTVPRHRPAAKAERNVADADAFTESLIVTGQAARLDKEGKLPAGATHKIVEDKDGKVKAVRRRFSIA